MIKTEIVNYVQTYLAQGYDIQSIRNTLATAGYTVQDINDSLANINAGPKSKFTFNKKLIFFGILGLLIMIMVIFGIFKLISIEEEPEIKKPPVKKIQKIEEPLSDRVLETQLNISVEPQKCVPDCDDGNKCTEDICVNGVCQYRNIIPCCGNNKCEEGENFENCRIDCKPPISFRESTGEIMGKATDLAKKDVQKAKILCLSLPTTNTVDKCLSVISIVALDSSICEAIYSENEKDLCYIDIAIEKEDFSLCHQIKDKWLKNSCLTFQRLKSTIN